MEGLKETSQILRNTHLKKLEKLLLLRLTTLYTYQEIIRAPGNLMEVDEKGIIIIFYQILLDSIKNENICKEYGVNEKKMFVTLMQKIFIEKRLFSMETVGSFVKVMSKLILIIYEDARFALTLLFIIYKLLNVINKFCFFKISKNQKYPKTLNLLDPENESFGLNVFNLDIDDPQGTNALNTNIIEELEKLLKVFSCILIK